MILTAKVNYWYTLWNVVSAVSDTLENQKQNLTLDEIIIVRTLIDKTHHKQINTSNCLIKTSINMLDLP